jgi:hypothetical protein
MGENSEQDGHWRVRIRFLPPSAADPRKAAAAPEKPEYDFFQRIHAAILRRSSR